MNLVEEWITPKCFSKTGSWPSDKILDTDDMLNRDKHTSLVVPSMYDKREKSFIILIGVVSVIILIYFVIDKLILWKGKLEHLFLASVFSLV
jgi:hypothetical protein